MSPARHAAVFVFALPTLVSAQICGTWALGDANSAPGPRYAHAMAYDASRGATILAGGIKCCPFEWQAQYQTWEWDGSTWTMQDPGSLQMKGHATVFDTWRGVTLRLDRTGTSEWTGSSWTELDAFFWDEHQATFDSHRGVVVAHLESGETIEGYQAPWSVASTAGPRRLFCGLAFDSSRNVTVLYGGMITQLTGSYETWEWDGQDWLLRDSNGPSANVASGLSYDPQHGVTILFGDTEQPETWRWDGTTWLPLLGAADGPIPNSGGTHQLVYDSARRRHVWYGYSFETWELALYDCDAATEPAAAESVPSCPNCPPRKNRYFSFEPPIGPENAKTAIRVTLTDLPAAGQCPGMPQDFSSFEGQQMWVGDEVLSNGGQPMGFFALATAPVFRDWTTLPGGVVHVSDCNVVPCATYAIEAISEGAWEAGLTQNFSPSLVVATTAAWGDVVGLGGIVNALDVAATVACTKAASSAPPKSWCDIYGSLASGGGDGVLNVLDVAAAVNALKGFSLNVAGPSAPAACD